jgi:hypothetical protein
MAFADKNDRRPTALRPVRTVTTTGASALFVDGRTTLDIERPRRPPSEDDIQGAA